MSKKDFKFRLKRVRPDNSEVQEEVTDGFYVLRIYHNGLITRHRADRGGAPKEIYPGAYRRPNASAS